MNDTPRTDALVNRLVEAGPDGNRFQGLSCEVQDLCRELERSLAEGTRRIFSANCAYCDWMLDDLPSLAAAKSEASLHRPVCARHPMRELEAYAGALADVLRKLVLCFGTKQYEGVWCITYSDGGRENFSHIVARSDGYEQAGAVTMMHSLLILARAALNEPVCESEIREVDAGDRLEAALDGPLTHHPDDFNSHYGTVVGKGPPNGQPSPVSRDGNVSGEASTERVKGPHSLQVNSPTPDLAARVRELEGHLGEIRQAGHRANVGTAPRGLKPAVDAAWIIRRCDNALESPFAKACGHAIDSRASKENSQPAVKCNHPAHDVCIYCDTGYAAANRGMNP